MRLTAALALALLLALAAPLAAQSIPTIGDTTAPLPTAPGHALITGPQEAVNPANGQVSVRIPVAVPRAAVSEWLAGQVGERSAGSGEPGQGR